MEGSGKVGRGLGWGWNGPNTGFGLGTDGTIDVCGARQENMYSNWAYGDVFTLEYENGKFRWYRNGDEQRSIYDMFGADAVANCWPSDPRFAVSGIEGVSFEIVSTSSN